jgi:cell filamentation protein
VQCRFDTLCLRTIHKHIFRDVYSWAGQFRTVNISKGGHPFATTAFIEPALDNVLRKLAEENYLRETDPGSFARRAGFFLGEINAVHPFREGNGRSQREFIRELGLQAGFIVDWSRITQDRMMMASRESFRSGDSSGLAAVISASLLHG